jgi:phage baseplate assembly protein V
MTIRETVRGAARRAYLAIARGTLKEADDKKKLQELSISLFAEETKVQVERFQNYGTTSVPKKRKDEENAAEHITAFLGSNRSHAVIIVLDDRRYRLYGLEEGESALYDDQQQKLHFKRDQILTQTHKKIVTRVVKDEDQAKDDAERDQSKEERKPLSSVILDKDKLTIKRTHEDDDDVLTSIVLEEKKITLLTKVGMKAIFDNDAKTVTIEGPNGTKFTLDDQAKTVTVNVDTKVYLGEPNAPRRAAAEGSIDSNGDTIVGNLAAKVNVK